MRRLTALCALSTLFAACSTDDSQLVVVLQSDLVVPTGLGEIDVSISDDSGQIVASQTFDLRTAGTSLPLSFGVAPIGGERTNPINITVIPRGPTVMTYPPIVRRVAELPEGRTVLPIFITDACKDQRCGMGQTCLIDQCGPVLVGTSDIVPAGEDGTELENACIPGTQRCTLDGRSVETCLTYGQPPRVAACPMDRMCVAALGRCSDPGEVFHQVQVNVGGAGSGRVTSTPPGIDCAEGGGALACSGMFLQGSRVTLTPSAEPGSSFAGWTGDCSGNGACLLDIDADKTVGASFDDTPPQQVMLAVNVSGGGIVVVDPGTAFEQTCDPVCNLMLIAGTQVTLDARPSPDSRFMSWSGPCAGGGAPQCTFTINQNETVTATFESVAPNPHVLNVSVVGGMGRITSDLGGIDCDTGEAGAECTASFSTPTAVLLTATPSPSSRFAGWRGDADACDDRTSTCMVQVQDQIDVIADFAFLNQDPWDVNGDGAHDLVVGAPGINSGSGRVYVFLGPMSFSGEVEALTAADVVFDGAVSNGRFGAAVAMGDVTADGVSDIIIGAPGEGAVYVVPGQANLQNATLGRITPPMAAGGTNFGTSLTPIPDVSGDGAPELFVGSPGSNQAFIWYGAPGLLSATPPMPAHAFAGPGGTAGPDESGAFVASLGDISGDGVPDLLVGAPNASNMMGSNAAGRAYVMITPAGGWPMMGGFMNAFVYEGIEPNQRFGVSGTRLGNFDVDLAGTNDFAIGSGSSGANGGGGVGVAFGPLGPPPAMPMPMPMNAMNLYFSGSPGSEMGRGLAGGADVTGDGVPDMLIGDPAVPSPAEGFVNLFRGDMSMPGLFAGVMAGDCATAATPTCARDNFGIDISIIGDLDGAGGPDIAVGSNFGGVPGGADARGRVVIFQGGQMDLNINSESAPLRILGEDVANGNFNVLPPRW